MALARRRRLLLPGPALIGFAEFFDISYGNPSTNRPYPKITPSRIGAVLLPFACPHCSAVRSEVIDPKKRNGYHDKDRDFSWCPACLKRYVINIDGSPLTAVLSPGATHAPALVDRAGKSEVVGLLVEDGLNDLGAD